MRTVSSTISNAVTENESVTMQIKAEIDPSRVFFKTLTANNPYDASPDYEIPTDSPVGQCMLYYGDKAYTFISDPSTGVIYGMEQGSSTKHNLSLTAETGTKPACASLGDGSAYLWYWDGTNLKRVTVNLSTWGTSGSTNISLPAHANWTVADGSPSAISSTQFVFCYKTSKGGIGVDYYDGNQWHSWDKRFISPKTITTKNWTIHTAGAIHNDSLFVYSTDMDSGEVRGVEYKSTGWTDSFIALPADLSRFCITNAVTSGGYVHLAGQFHRTEDLEDAKVHSLVLRSINGRTFSWDRFTLLSTLGYQFGVALDNTNLKVYASDRNCVGVENMSHYFCETPPDRVTLQPPHDIVTFQLNSTNSASIRISSYDESYMFHDVIRKGSRIKIYMGFITTEGTEYAHYQTFTIDTRSQGFSSGKRFITLGLVDSGTWKSNQIAFPFYSELLSKTTQLDDCDENDRLYPVETKSPSPVSRLVIDFTNNDEWTGDGAVSGTPSKWADDGGSLSPKIWSYPETERFLFKTVDLNEYYMLDEYPTITNLALQVYIYGWERTEQSSRPNSTWSIYAVTAPEDDLDNKTATGGSLVGGYDAWFPRDYPTYDEGSYPIKYEWTNLTAGHKLLYFGISVYNNSTGTSHALPERLSVNNLDFSFVQDKTNLTWEPDNPDPDTYDSNMLKYPDTGIPSILFATKPYTSFNFRVWAEFVYIPGASPLSPGTTGWGCVGIAKDGTNCVIARYKRQNTKFEIVKLRAGVETVLADWTPPTTDIEKIMLDHRDGLIRVWYATSNTWIGPALSYHWDETNQGAMSMSETGIMHVGIYGAVNPPGYHCCSFSISDGKGIGIIPGFLLSVLDSFPSSGAIRVNEKKYSYTGKTSNINIYGPYQGRQSGDYGTYSEDSTEYTATAAEIALYKPNNSATYCSGLLFCTESGHTWLLENSDWTVTHYTGGEPNYLRNRSRHYCDTVNGNYVGPGVRCYITAGLTGIIKDDTGASFIHPLGSYVSLWSSDKIYARQVLSTQVDQDATVRDMVQYLCHTACVDTEFPGDWTSDTENLSGTPVQLASGTTLFPGGFDVQFTLPSLSTSQWIAVYASNLYLLNPDNETQKEAIDFGFRNNAGTLEVYAYPKTGYNDPVYFSTTINPASAHSVRLLFHEEFCSIYADGTWVMTFAFRENLIEFPPNDEQLYIYAYASTSKSITDVKIVELFDWREAIYVESEMSAQSALGSVIQERPVEVAPLPNGGLQFSYNIVRDTITYTDAQTKRIFSKHQREDGTSPDAGSDAMVYYSDITFAECTKFAEEDGFLTRVFKLSGLDTGAGTAARIILEKAFERQYIHNITMRPDPRIEIGDKVTFTYTVPGTGTVINYTMIVEQITIGIEEGAYAMNITGREDL